jgi:cephalosporin-C deacetylase-like acetyl esterase
MKTPFFALALLPSFCMAQSAAPFRDYLERLALEQLAQRDSAVAQLTTRAQWDERRAHVRQTFLKMLGGLPIERAPLNIRRMGTLDRASYRVEKIVFESLPGMYVTGNLYIPQTGQPPYPAVLQPTGHSTTAKNRAFYQTLAIGLAKQGFVVLTYDPLGQGERRVFYDAELEDSKVGSTTMEHSMIGIRALLAGESVARYFVWDAMRALDVLESTPVVDRNRLGVTGCSGGGTVTVYLSALDARVKAAAPSCYVTSWEQQIPTAGPQDAEQQFPDQMKAGIDHIDLVSLAAPMPYLICSTDQDFFSLDGARKAFESARRIWEVYGASDRIDWFHEPGAHGVYKAGRERIYAWMRRWLRQENVGARVDEPPIETEPEELLNCTPTGQLATSLKGETPSSIDSRRFSVIPGRRRDLRGKVLRLTRYASAEVPMNLRSLARTEVEGYRVERLSFDTARGLTIPALLITPASATAPARAALYLNQAGKSSNGKPQPDAIELARQGHTVLALDPSGIGELASRSRGYADQWFGQERISWLALMTGRPLVSLQMRDILRGIDVLEAKGFATPPGVLGVGRGLISVALLHAAAIDTRLGRLILEDMPCSFAAIARAPIHRGVFEVVIPGVLGQYDLPDLVASVAPRPVTLLNLRSPTGANLLLQNRVAEYRYAIETYQASGNAKALDIRPRREDESLLQPAY